MGKAMKEKGLIEKQKRGCNGHFCDGGCSSTIASSGDSPAPDCGGRGGGELLLLLKVILSDCQPTCPAL